VRASILGLNPRVFAKHLQNCKFIVTTDFLLLPPGTKSPLLFILKHAPVFISGFDLTDSCMSDLDQHLNRHAIIMSWRSSVESFYDSLSLHSETAQEKGIADHSITNPDIASLQKTLAGYGDAALAGVTADIQQWCATYTWKASSSGYLAATTGGRLGTEHRAVSVGLQQLGMPFFDPTQTQAIPTSDAAVQP
jgi:hypothetical protein